MERLLPPILLIITLGFMVLVTVIWPLGGPFPAPLRAIGALLVVIGVLIAAKGARTFKEVGTNIMTFDEPNKLVTTGLFAWSRNPMYLGFALCALGSAITLGAVSALIIAVFFCVTLDRWYVRFEEAVMHETFGADYTTYCTHVRRWL